VPSLGIRSHHHATPQAVAAERHASVVMLPLVQIFVQLRSSERGLTQDEAHQRLLEGCPSDTALAAVAERTTVFARVSPAQKNRIILGQWGRRSERCRRHSPA
jgi:hypothetical protein